jgi:hypothetical protein
MDGVADPPQAELCFKVAGSFEDERVVAVGSVRVSFWNRLVDQKRKSKLVGDGDSDVQRGILTRPHGVMEPVQDELARLSLSRQPDDPRPLPKLAGQVLQIVLGPIHCGKPRKGRSVQTDHGAMAGSSGDRAVAG